MIKQSNKNHGYTFEETTFLDFEHVLLFTKGSGEIRRDWPLVLENHFFSLVCHLVVLSSDLSLSFDIENKNLRNWETETTTVTNGLFTLEDRTSSWQSVLLQEEYLVMFSHHHHLVFQIRDCEEAGSFSTNAISKWHSLTPEGLLISSPSLIVL